MARKSRFGYIRKLPSGNYQASYKYQLETHKAPYTFPTKTEAKNWLAEQQLTLSRGEWIPPHQTEALQRSRASKKPTFNEWADMWLQQLENRSASPNTLRSYISILRKHLRPVFGQMRLDEITTQFIREWHNTLPAASPGARYNAYRCLSAAMAAAVDEEVIKETPVKIKGAGAKKKIRDEARERVAELADVEKIAENMKEQRYAIMVWLAAAAGLRYSEIAALRLKHYDPTERVLKIRAGVKRAPNGELLEGPPKTRLSVRDVPVSPLLADKLEEHINRFRSGAGAEELLVAPVKTRKERAFVSNKALHTSFNPACEAAGLPGFGFHQLRATCATQLMRSGATPAEIQAILGHSDWATSVLYQRAPKERLADAVSRMFS